MTLALSGAARPARRDLAQIYVRAGSAVWLNRFVAFWVFAGGFVIFEPSPYELAFFLVLPFALSGGLGLHRKAAPLLALFFLFIPFAIIGAFQATFTETPAALIFVIVTIFLFFTSYFVANYVADAPIERTRIIMRAYVAVAVLSALLGTLGYLGLLPGAELLLRYGRAKALFQDPNVYGPFLILPAVYLLQRLLLGERGTFWSALMFGALFVGVFVSFSRGAWAYLAVSMAMVFILCFALEAGARQKVRMMLLALGGGLMLLIALAGLLSIPSVNRLFEERASEQNHDSGETGRFGRQAYAFDLALAHPWGIGPLEFRNLRIVEEPHNTYVNVIHVYGWGGGFVYWVLVAMTVWRGVAGLARPSPLRPLLIPVVAAYIPLVVEAAIIDTDHWRHYFLLVGLIWGLTSGSARAPISARPKPA